MKIRTGFVSNSSTSSFVIGKNYMTPEQIEEFKKMLAEWQDDNEMYETFIEETPLYFLGEISNHNTVVNKWLESKNLIKFADSCG